MARLPLSLKDRTAHAKTLGVPLTASTDDIKKAWRTLASKYHPDQKTGNVEKMKSINAAWDALKDAGPYVPEAPQKTTTRTPASSPSNPRTADESDFKKMKRGAYAAFKAFALEKTEKWVDDSYAADPSSFRLKVAPRKAPKKRLYYVHNLKRAGLNGVNFKVEYASKLMPGRNIFPLPYIVYRNGEWFVRNAPGTCFETTLSPEKAQTNTLTFSIKDGGKIEMVFLNDHDTLAFNPDEPDPHVTDKDAVFKRLEKLHKDRDRKTSKIWQSVVNATRS
jgi:hypothetical protein